MDKDTRIYLDKNSHAYYKNGQEYISVSELTSKYKQPFNQEYWSWRKGWEALEIEKIKSGPRGNLADSTILKDAKNKIKDDISRYLMSPGSSIFEDDYENLNLLFKAVKYANIPLKNLEEHRNQILEQWKGKRDTANVKGNSYHRGRELNAIARGFEINAFDNKEYSIHPEILLNAYPDSDDPTLEVYEELMWNMDFATQKRAISNNYYEDLPDGFYPELLLWNDDYKIAGTSDKIFIESNRGIGTRMVDVDDYKTSAVIDKKSFYVRGKGHRMMQYPLDNLMDCKHTHYHLQVSVYAYMLEEMGFEVRNVGYHHLNFLHKLPYLRDEVIAMLNDYRGTYFTNKL